MSEDDGENKPSLLRVVSENPDAPGRAVREARQRAQHALANLAATMLRTMAGSESAPRIMRSISELIDAQKELYALSGEWLSFEEEHKALSLPHSELDADDSDDSYREWQRSRGMERILQGALRLAAHQVLGEQPHFGGKYSEDLIDDGIAAIERSREPPPKPPTKKGKAEKAAFQRRFGDRLSTEPEPSVRRKPWSSRDSRSYRDPKPED